MMLVICFFKENHLILFKVKNIIFTTFNRANDNISEDGNLFLQICNTSLVEQFKNYV